jgi:hypothetical protein
VGCLWELNPTKSSDRTAANDVWLGGAMWSAPRAEQSQFRGQAIPARGGKLLGEGTRSTPQDLTSQSPHQAIPATDGGASRCGEARRRSGVHVVRTMISEVPASRGRMPLNDWSWADRHEGRREPGPTHPHPRLWRPAGSPSRAAGRTGPSAGGGSAAPPQAPRTKPRPWDPPSGPAASGLVPCFGHPQHHVAELGRREWGAEIKSESATDSDSDCASRLRVRCSGMWTYQPGAATSIEVTGESGQSKLKPRLPAAGARPDSEDRTIMIRGASVAPGRAAAAGAAAAAGPHLHVHAGHGDGHGDRDSRAAAAADSDGGRTAAATAGPWLPVPGSVRTRWTQTRHASGSTAAAAAASFSGPGRRAGQAARRVPGPGPAAPRLPRALAPVRQSGRIGCRAPPGLRPSRPPPPPSGSLAGGRGTAAARAAAAARRCYGPALAEPWQCHTL